MSAIEVSSAYYVREQYVGGALVSTQDVDARGVRLFLDAAPFFDSLVDSPEQHEQLPNGTIRVTQRTPSGDTQVTAFTPRPTVVPSWGTDTGTRTEHDAERVERQHVRDRYDDDRPTRAEAERDAAEAGDL